ncbi:class I SAM-dependent methyltransferase [Alsobacter sp. R-9]
MTAGAAPIPFEKHRFATASGFYDAYRVPYDPAVLAWALARTGVDGTSRVLDLGCGPGTLAIPIARVAGAVTALDPEPSMLARGRQRAAEAGVSVDFVEGSSNDLSVVSGPFRLVTMGRSFHWMDRPATLAALDALVQPEGALALFATTSPRSSPWWEAARTVAERYASDGMAASRWRRQPGWQPHEAMLLASPFRHVERYGIVGTERITVDHALGRLFSMSSTSPGRLGDAREAFEVEAREALAAHAVDGWLEGIVETQVLLATRGQ